MHARGFHDEAPTTWWKGLVRPSSLLLLGILLIAGCTSSTTVTPSKARAIESGDKCVLLLRVIAVNLDGEEIAPFGGDYTHQNYAFGVCSLATGGEMVGIESWFLSESLQQEGWVALLLDPGGHYLNLISPQRQSAHPGPAGFAFMPFWRCQISERERLVYGGTIGVVVEMHELLMFNINVGGVVYAPDLLEGDKAAAVSHLRAYFPHAGEPVVRFMTPYTGGPLIF